MFCLGLVIYFLDSSVEDYEGVVDEDMGDVLGYEWVDAGFAELFVLVFDDGDGYVVEASLFPAWFPPLMMLKHGTGMVCLPLALPAILA